VDPDQILPTMLTLRRFAWCPLCGHRARLIVQPLGLLTCRTCSGSLVIVVERDAREAATSVSPRLLSLSAAC